MDENVALEAAGHLFKKIGSHDPKTIAKVLLNGKPHPLIKLERSNLGDEGVILISKALKQQAIITSLDLSDNNITAVGMKELAQAVNINKSLKYLKLDGNHFGDEGLALLSQGLKNKSSTLKSLYLSDCKITSKGIVHLTESLENNKSVETIHLNSNTIGVEGAVLLSKLLHSNHTLRNISLFFCGIGEGGAKSFLQCLQQQQNHDKFSLCTLNLKGNKVPGPILESINTLLNDKKSREKQLKLKLEAQSLIDEEADRVIKIRLANVNEELEKKLSEKIKHIDEESKKKLDEKMKNIDEESKKKLEEKMKDLSQENQKKWTEKLKVIEKKEEEVNTKEQSLNTKNSEFSERLKQFEKNKLQIQQQKQQAVLNEKKKLKSSSDKEIKKSSDSGSSSKKKESSSSSEPARKKHGDSIVIAIAGDKFKDKEQLVNYFISTLDDCKIEAENDFEKIITGWIVVDGKSIHFTFVNTSSDDRYSRLRALQYEQADAAIVAFTTYDRVSFEDIPFQWIPEIQFMGKIPIYITGMFPEIRSKPPKTTDITEKEGRESSLKFGACNYFEPTGPDDIKKMVSVLLKDIKKKKK
eukprot:gene10112-12404_t